MRNVLIGMRKEKEKRDLSRGASSIIREFMNVVFVFCDAYLSMVTVMLGIRTKVCFLGIHL